MEVTLTPDVQHSKHQVHLNQAPAAIASPSSASSSPSHEFSFTISLHSPLSPADEIFFHGQLLPLHLLSHLPPISPRHSFDDSSTNPKTSDHGESSVLEGKERGKSRSFSLFGQRRESELKDEQQKKKSKFEALKKYLGFVFRNKKRGDLREQQQEGYSSYSGNLAVKKKKKNEFRSEPVSMRTSPTNSGRMVARTPCSVGKNDSTMEELQAAIQAAIAHCKNSSNGAAV